LFDLGNTLKVYADEVSLRGASHPNHNQGDEEHLVRSRCIAEAAQFWMSIAQVNDSARMKLLREFFKFNLNANKFFALHALLRMPAPGNTAPAPDARHAPPASPFGRPGGIPEADRTNPCSFSRLPHYSFNTPESAVYPAEATHPFSPAPGETDEESRIRIDKSFRTLEDGFLRSFVIEGTMGGSKKLGEATEEIEKMGFSGLKEGAALVAIERSCKLDESERVASLSPFPENLGSGIRLEDASVQTNWSEIPVSHRRPGFGMPAPQSPIDLFSACPYLGKLRNHPGMKVADHQLLAELVAKTDKKKESKGYSSKAPFPCSMKEIVTAKSVDTSFASYLDFMNIEESTRPTSVVKEQSKGWPAGMVRVESYQEGQDDETEFVFKFPRHQSSLENAWSHTRVDGQLDVIPEEVKVAEETPIGKVRDNSEKPSVCTSLDTFEKPSVGTDPKSLVNADKSSEYTDEMLPKGNPKMFVTSESDDHDLFQNSSVDTEKLFPHFSEAAFSGAAFSEEKSHRPKRNVKVTGRIPGTLLTRTGNFFVRPDGTLKLTAPKMRNSSWGYMEDIRVRTQEGYFRSETLMSNPDTLMSNPDTDIDLASMNTLRFSSAPIASLKDGSIRTIVKIDSSQLI
jgi:hypothetical protein